MKKLMSFRLEITNKKFELYNKDLILPLIKYKIQLVTNDFLIT